MSRTIDQRVVEMRFDNRQFEQGVSTSMSTLDKLKKALRFDGATKSLDNIGAAAKGVDFSPLSGAVEKVQRGFSALEVIGVTALANITNSAVNTGKQLIKSLTVDQVMDGWKKLADKTTSVATLIAQGYDMDTVEEQLSRLNWFTDETSYNFTDMVSNISKFTASGKGLEESVTAMEGIANWAALSGQNANTASHAMFQLSQAMGAGVMRKEDYKSIQNVSMDTDEFRQKALDAGVALGTLKKNVDGTYISLVNANDTFTKSQFAEHLTKDAWFTSDVMMKVFNDYSQAVDQIYEYAEEKGITASQAIEELGGSVDEFGLKAFLAAQEAKTFGDALDATKDAVSTGWMNTFELIFGNYEEQRVLWTNLANAMYDVFASSSEARNNLLKGWKELGGRDLLVDSFWNTWNAIFGGISKDGTEVIGVLTTVKTAFREIFPETTAQKLYEFTEQFHDLTEKITKFGSSTTTMTDKLKKIATEGVSKYVQSAYSMSSFKVNNLMALAEKTGYNMDPFTEFVNGIPTVKGDKAQATITRLMKTVKDAGDVYELLAEASGMEVEYFRELHKIGETAGFDSEAFHELASGLSEGDAAFEEFIKTMLKAVEMNGPLENLRNTFKGFFAALSIGKQAVSAVIKGLAPLGKALLSLGGSILGVTGSIGEWLVELDRSLQYGEGLSKITDGVYNALSKVIGFIEKFISGLGSANKVTQKLSDSVDGAAESLDNLSSKSKVLEFLKTIGEAIGQIMSALASVAGRGFKKIAELISEINFDQVAEAIDTLSFGALSVGLVKFVSYLKKPLEELGSIKESVIGVIDAVGGRFSAMEKSINAKSLLTIAVAVGVLATSLLILASIDAEKLGTALAGIAALFGELVGSFALVGKIGSVKGSGSLMLISTSLLILVSALKAVSDLSFTQIVTGLTGVAGALLLLFTALSGMPKDIVTSGGSLLAVAVAIRILASAMNSLGKLNGDQVLTSFTALGGALLIIAVAMRGMPKNLAVIGTGFLIVSVALQLFAVALRMIGSAPMDTIGKAILALGFSLGILAVGLDAMQGSIKGSAALIIAASALAIMAPALILMGSLSLASIAKALLVIAGSFTVLGIAGALLTPVIPAILALSGAMALIGLAVLGIGTGLFAAGAGLSALAVGITTLAGVTVGAAASIASSLFIIGSSLLSLLPLFIEKIGEGIVAFCVAIGNGAEAIGESFRKIFVVVVDVILTTLVEYTPKIVELLLDFIIEVLNALATRMPELIGAITNFVGALFKSIGDAIRAIDTETMLQDLGIIALITGLIVGLSVIGPMIPNAMVALIGVAAFIAELSLVLAAFGALNQIPGLNWLVNEGGKLLQSVGTAIGGFVGGIVGGFMSGVSSQFPKIGKDLSEFMTNVKPFIEGAKSVDSRVLKGVADLSAAILLLTGADLLSGIASFISGKSSLSNFGKELVPFGLAIREYSNIVSGIDGTIVTASANAAKALVELSNNLPKQGGVVGWFSGSNDMASFGDNLVTFGEKFSEYALKIQNVDTSVVSATSNATRAIVEISNAIPKTGLFSGNTSIADFGSLLSSFGYYFSNYYGYISGIDTSVLSAVTQEMNNLVGMAKGLKDVDTGKIAGFGSSLSTLGSIGLDNFLKAFTGATSKIQDAANTLTDRFLVAASAKKLSYYNKFKELAESCISGLRINYNDFYNAGEYLVEGFAKGISANTYLAEARGRAMAAAAARAARAELNINSPSKVGWEIGDFFGLGFVNAIDAYQKKAYDASAEMAASAESGLTAAASKIQNAIEGNLETQPVIRPVLDLSNIQAGSRYLNGLIPQGGIHTVRGAELSSRITTDFGSEGSVNPRIQNGTPTTVSNATNTFNIYGTNAQEIAQEVSKILNNQVQRRERAWA